MLRHQKLTICRPQPEIYIDKLNLSKDLVDEYLQKINTSDYAAWNAFYYAIEMIKNDVGNLYYLHSILDLLTCNYPFWIEAHINKACLANEISKKFDFSLLDDAIESLNIAKKLAKNISSKDRLVLNNKKYTTKGNIHSYFGLILATLNGSTYPGSVKHDMLGQYYYFIALLRREKNAFILLKSLSYKINFH
jgi:hypothetical protein